MPVRAHAVSHRTSLVSLVLLSALTACGDASADLTASTGGAASLSVSFGQSSTTSAATIVGTAADTMRITSVQLVLSHLKLRRDGIAACADIAVSGSGSGSGGSGSVNSNTSIDVGGCSRLDHGPLLVDLPLSSASTSPLSVTIPAGTYRSFEFEIDNVNAGSNATAEEKSFLAANPQFRDVTIRVTGTYKGAAFTFLSRAQSEVEFEFEPSLTVESGVNDNVSVVLDLAGWFKDSSGAVLNPTVANQTRIDQNIIASFSAFGDRDRDRHEDSGRGRERGRGSSKND